ncbi:MAG: hypothetical protein ACRCYS_07850 [Beijerinckiaceae bacterium]
MTIIDIKPWSRFKALKQQAAIRRWLMSVSKSSQSVFIAGMNGRHSGRIYRRRGRIHQASAPGEFPATDSGRLLASLKGQVMTDEAKIGTSAYYAKWLRGGSRKMQRRKMSDDAMKEGIAVNKGRAKGWVAWRK